MNRIIKYEKPLIRVNNSKEGKSIEKQIYDAVYNQDTIEMDAPLIYTPKSEGVVPQYDIRTDKWELARQASQKVLEFKLQKEAEKEAESAEKKKIAEDGKPQPDGTEN